MIASVPTNCILIHRGVGGQDRRSHTPCAEGSPQENISELPGGSFSTISHYGPPVPKAEPCSQHHGGWEPSTQTALKRARSSLCDRCCLKSLECSGVRQLVSHQPLPTASLPPGIYPGLKSCCCYSPLPPSLQAGQSHPQGNKVRKHKPFMSALANHEPWLCFVATPPCHHSLESNC